MLDWKWMVLAKAQIFMLTAMLVVTTMENNQIGSIVSSFGIVLMTFMVELQRHEEKTMVEKNQVG